MLHHDGVDLPLPPKWFSRQVVEFCFVNYAPVQRTGYAILSLIIISDPQGERRWRKCSMANVKDITNIWKTVREVDLRPIREAALKQPRITLAGAPGSGRHTLAEQLRRDPAHPEIYLPTPIKIADLDSGSIPESELVIMVLDASRSDFKREDELARRLGDAGGKVLIFVNKIDQLQQGQVDKDWLELPVSRMVYGSATDPASLEKQFIPAVMELLPDMHLALARSYPLFRVTIANHLINDTSFSNAAYSFTTGIAEIIPALGVPLNIADMVVLTKAQGFLVYRLGLSLGFSTEWRDYVGEFGSVIGSGFMWRQMARSLVGLIPVWGIVPKVGVAYAGTYVVGHVILRWYLTGKHMTRAQMRELYVRAFGMGKIFARNLMEKAPRPRLARRKRAALPKPSKTKPCPHCGKTNSADASYCQYCGLPIA
jgi:uncharacterized protein (DUF697 family)